MTMNRDVFLSLLALDAYNRGYGANVGGLPESGEIGDASITTRQEIFGDDAAAILQNWQAAGFYAIAYDWNGERVISFRGTNFGADRLPAG
ncbi:MAG: hypothetical protein KJZ64_13395 [Sphingomonadaceae bacterium]|nr:hypothetical protein [Sphingomonadaceae bacterium]